MHRIDTATKAVDLFGAGKHGFKDGDKASAIPATGLTAAFFNDLQENLIGIIEAAGIAPVKGTYTQLLAALRAAGVFETPAQFDNTTKAATTAFVQRALGNFASVDFYVASATLLASHAGKMIDFYGASPATLTLPDANAFPNGGALNLTNLGSANLTVARAGADTITTNGGSFTSVVISPGETLTVVGISSSVWLAVGGTALLKYASSFGSSLAANGYQKLPSGLIVQWGAITTSGAGYSNITFPIAFPTVMQSITGNVDASTAVNYAINFDNTTKTQTTIPVAAVTTAGAYVASGIRWTAFGY